MKEETIEKIEDEIEKKTKMPGNLKEILRKEIFANIILAICIVIYFIFLVVGSIGTQKITREVDFKIFSLVLLFASIVLFEIAYKKDNFKLALNGIEILIIATITLFLPYIVFELDITHQKYYIISGSIIAIYYVIKSIVLANKAKKVYEKQASDIKEITKKENKNFDFLDEEIEEDVNNVDQNDSQKNKVTKKRGRPKKDVGANTNSKPKENKTPKKRGRPKKGGKK